MRNDSLNVLPGILGLDGAARVLGGLAFSNEAMASADGGRDVNTTPLAEWYSGANSSLGPISQLAITLR